MTAAATVGAIAVRVAAPLPRGAARGLRCAVAAIDRQGDGWRVTLAHARWLGLGRAALPLVVGLPAGVGLPLAVGDAVVLRAESSVAGLHPRRSVEVRRGGVTVLAEGEDGFLDGLAGISVATQGRALRIEVAGAVGLTDDPTTKVLATPLGALCFAGQAWSGSGAGTPPADASSGRRLALVLARA